MAKFFDSNQDGGQDQDNKEGSEEVSKIKLGDTEYDTNQVQGWVEKAKALEEFETKQGQKWEDVKESWGKRGEVIGKFKKLTGVETPEELEERRSAEEKEEKAKLESKAGSGEDLTPEEQDKLVKEALTKQLKDLGYVSKDEFDQLYQERRSGERLFSQVNKVIKKAESEGKPSISAEDLLLFMADPNNPKDPDIAYKVKFEKELDDWKTNQLSKMNKKGIITEDKTTAGGKDFTPKAPTSENLTEVLKEHFSID